jgi:hypothetical protein
MIVSAARSSGCVKLTLDGVAVRLASATSPGASGCIVGGVLSPHPAAAAAAAKAASPSRACHARVPAHAPRNTVTCACRRTIFMPPDEPAP